METIRITLDEPTRAFYAGVAAASKANEQIAALTPAVPFKQQTMLFWLKVGAGYPQLFPEILTEPTDDLLENYIAGAVSQAPTEQNLFTLTIPGPLPGIGEDEEDETRIRAAVHSYLGTVGQYVRDGVDEDDIWTPGKRNGAHVKVGHFKLDLFL